MPEKNCKKSKGGVVHYLVTSCFNCCGNIFSSFDIIEASNGDDAIKKWKEKTIKSGAVAVPDNDGEYTIGNMRLTVVDVKFIYTCEKNTLIKFGVA